MFWVLALVACATLAPLDASEVRFFSLASRDVFLDGELEGVGVDSLGVLRLAQRVARVGAVEEPFVYAATVHPKGWVLATGNAGRLVLLDREGGSTSLIEAEDPTLFAVAVEEDGTVWAGSSPGGRLHRVAGDGSQTVIETGETYVWDIAVDGEGGVWVATGTEGRLHRIRGDGTGEIVFEAGDVHVRTLAVLPGGDLLLGTAGEGLIVLVSSDGSARTLYDSGLAEIVALEVGADGQCYAAAIRSEAGFVQSGTQPANDLGAGATVSVLEQGFEAPSAAGENGVRSLVLRFPCTGGVVETMWRFGEETIYDLMWSDSRLWIATGQEGKVYSLADGDVVLEKDLSERQVVALLPGVHGPTLVTTNAAAVYEVLPDREREGSYTSPVLDAGEIASFGTLHWRGERAGGGVRFALRSGMSGTPDRTWSDWSKSASGTEIDLAAIPPGRFVQFRLDLAAASPSPTVSEITISYRQKNLAPRIGTLLILDAGQVLVPANFNPASQVFEPVSPGRDGIFTTLSPDVEGDNQRLKPLWKRGYRTLQWEAEDPNGDQLEYRLEFRPEADARAWFPMVDEHSDTYFSFDSTVLPDGVYRFRLTASDGAGNGDGEALETMRVSGPVAVDHTPPLLGRVERGSSRLSFVVTDALNALRQAEYSVDGGSWIAATPVDGLLDGRSERFEVDAPPGARLILFRAMDTSFNLATFDLSPTP